VSTVSVPADPVPAPVSVNWVPSTQAVSVPVAFVTRVTLISSFDENVKDVLKETVAPSPEYVTLKTSELTVISYSNTIYSI
jgi:hypothetical protein